MVRRRKPSRSLLIALLLGSVVSGARAAEVSGWVEMPEFCSAVVSPAVVRLEPLNDPKILRSAEFEAPRSVFIDQSGLMFEPRVVAMRTGDTLRFGNADPDSHNVHIEGRGVSVNQVVSPGGTLEFVPSEPGVLRVVCDVHTHMRAYVVVGSSPWVATCERSGRFRLFDVPEGRYRLLVWHEMGAPLVQIVAVNGVTVDLGRLVAPAGSNSATAADREQICEKGCEPWPLVIDRISVTLAESLDASRRADSAPRAVSLAQDAYYRDFESSGMGTAIRVHLGRERATRVDDLFREIAHTTSDVSAGKLPSAIDLDRPTRLVLMTLAQASGELSRKGVTERSRIFSGTSPAFWIEDTSGKAPVVLVGFTGALMTNPVIVLLVGIAAVILLAILGAAVARARFAASVLRPVRALTVAGLLAAVAVMALMLLPNRDRSSPAAVRGPRTAPAPGVRRGFVSSVDGPSAPPKAPTSAPAAPVRPMLREYPIGLDIKRNHLDVAAAWHPAVRPAGGPAPAPGDIHLLAKVEATEGNPNGFAKGDWVPYLSIRYTVIPARDNSPQVGVLRPLVAPDGPRYGANLTLPGPGEYRLRLQIAPPPDDALGRFVDPTNGVAPWWEPFDLNLEWSFRPESTPKANGGSTPGSQITARATE